MNGSSRSSSLSERAQVLFVDDEPLVLDGLHRLVHGKFTADLARSSEEGLDKIRTNGPYPVVVSDMLMPGMDGVEFLSLVRNIAPESTRIMLTGTADIGSAIRAVNEGRIFHYLTKPVSPDEILTTLQAGMASYHAVRNEQEKLRAAITTVELLDVGTLTALARAIDAKSKWTAGHSERVASLALRLAHVLQVSGRDLQIIHRGSLLHDIGKIGTPAAILDKPHRLTPAEMDIMRDHVAIGVRILEPIPIFRDVLPLVAQHHEWYDGSGYPAGLRGKEIALPARILTVADCFDAIVSDRPYRRGVSPLRAVEILTERAARQFDPDVVRAFGALVSPKS